MTKPSSLSHSALQFDARRHAVFWEDMEPGLQFSSSSRTITESDVVSFAAWTADYSRLHVDAEYAAASSFGQRIAHGMLVASVSVGLLTRTVQSQWMEGSMLALLENRLSFPKPTFIGDTVHVIAKVAERRESKKADRGIVTFHRQTLNQRGEVVVDSDATLLMKRRPQEATE